MRERYCLNWLEWILLDYGQSGLEFGFRYALMGNIMRWIGLGFMIISLLSGLSCKKSTTIPSAEVVQKIQPKFFVYRMLKGFLYRPLKNQKM